MDDLKYLIPLDLKYHCKSIIGLKQLTVLGFFSLQDLSSGPYPVMVWMYGGAYQGGASIQYPGHFLAAQGVVVVVPNYRLDIFGKYLLKSGTLVLPVGVIALQANFRSFVRLDWWFWKQWSILSTGFGYSGDEHCPGNMGLWDQNMALEFVQENIANFGGDANMVTIFGQSAGASSTGFHLMSPKSEGDVELWIQQKSSNTVVSHYQSIPATACTKKWWAEYHTVARPYLSCFFFSFCC